MEWCWANCRHSTELGSHIFTHRTLDGLIQTIRQCAIDISVKNNISRECVYIFELGRLINYYERVVSSTILVKRGDYARINMLMKYTPLKRHDQNHKGRGFNAYCSSVACMGLWIRIRRLLCAASFPKAMLTCHKRNKKKQHKTVTFNKMQIIFQNPRAFVHAFNGGVC